MSPAVTFPEEAFAKFDDEQLNRLKHYGSCENHARGTILFQEGDMLIDLFVVLDGIIGVYQNTREGLLPVAKQHPGQFTGETANLAGSMALVMAKADSDIHVIRITPERLSSVLIEDSEISDIFVKTFLIRRMVMNKGGISPIKVIGSRFSQDTFRIRDFLMKSNQPFSWLDIDTDKGGELLLAETGYGVEDIPIVMCQGNHIHKNPTNEHLAEIMGIDCCPGDESEVIDMLVVGGGPAGLSTAVYAASDGLRVTLLDANAPGGQAATSSKIENYLGFPLGISGSELAERAWAQALKFGAKIASSKKALKLEREDDHYAVTVSGGEKLRARSIVVATGAQYRKLETEGINQYEGRGVYYGATGIESQYCDNSEIAIVGGGNSAGQAAVYLAKCAKNVHIFIRRNSLGETMSRYLIRRIEETPNIHLHPNTEITQVLGDGKHIHSIEVTHNKTHHTQNFDLARIFCFLGATPRTEWLEGQVCLDDHGYIRTGASLEQAELSCLGWDLTRRPETFETCMPRIFAVGDVRSGSIKRVASAVGEGAIAVELLYTELMAT